MRRLGQGEVKGESKAGWAITLSGPSQGQDTRDYQDVGMDWIKRQLSF